MSNLDTELAFRNKLIAKLKLSSELLLKSTDAYNDDHDNILKFSNAINDEILESKSLMSNTTETNANTTIPLNHDVISNNNITNTEDSHLVATPSQYKNNDNHINSKPSSDIEIVEHVEPYVPPIILDSYSDDNLSSKKLCDNNIDDIFNKDNSENNDKRIIKNEINLKKQKKKHKKKHKKKKHKDSESDVNNKEIKTVKIKKLLISPEKTSLEFGSSDSKHKSISPKRISRSPNNRSEPSKYKSRSPNRRSRSPKYRSRSSKRRSRSPYRRSRSPKYRSRSPKYKSRSSRYRSRSPYYRSKSPKHRSRSSRYISRSPKYRSRSPRYRSRSPRYRSRSPRYRSRSPRYRSMSPKYKSRSPRYRSRSPKSTSKHYKRRSSRTSSSSDSSQKSSKKQNGVEKPGQTKPTCNSVSNGSGGDDAPISTTEVTGLDVPANDVGSLNLEIEQRDDLMADRRLRLLNAPTQGDELVKPAHPLTFQEQIRLIREEAMKETQALVERKNTNSNMDASNIGDDDNIVIDLDSPEQATTDLDLLHIPLPTIPTTHIPLPLNVSEIQLPVDPSKNDDVSKANPPELKDNRIKPSIKIDKIQLSAESKFIIESGIKILSNKQIEDIEINKAALCHNDHAISAEVESPIDQDKSMTTVQSSEIYSSSNPTKSIDVKILKNDPGFRTRDIQVAEEAIDVHSPKPKVDRERSSRADRSRKHSPDINREVRRRYRRSRSRSTGRSRHRSRDRRRSRSRERRSRRSRSRDYRRRSRSRSHGKRNSEKLHSSNSSRNSNPINERLGIDRDQLRKIAISKTLMKLESGEMNISTEKTTSNNVSSSVDELTSFCKKMRGDGDDGSGDLDRAKDILRARNETFKSGSNLDNNAPIVMNIANARNLKVLTPAEKIIKGAKLREQFPVSTGGNHNKQLNEWVSVEPKEDYKLRDQDVKYSYSSNAQHSKNNNCKNDAPKKVSTSVSDLIGKRMENIKSMNSNPSETDNIKSVKELQEGIQSWVNEQRQINEQQNFGRFTGQESGLTQNTNLTSNKGPQAWAHKDMFAKAAPVVSGIGMSLMAKMGWKSGEGLGKHKDGSVIPLSVDIKMNRKGLQSIAEPAPGKDFHKKEACTRQPVAIVNDFCIKRSIPPAIYTIVSESGPSHNKCFLFKVFVDGKFYQAENGNKSKKQAKADAASVFIDNNL